MPESYSEAASRHFEDASHLAAKERWDGAGYLIGYAVECAIKSAIGAARPIVAEDRKHLPKLIDRAKKSPRGRRQQSVLTLLEKTGFMEGWDIEMRYWADRSINEERYKGWRADASRMLAAANLRRRSS